MSLKVVISLALCALAQAQARPRLDDGLQEAISNLQLLIPILVENSLAEQRGAGESPPARSAYLAPGPDSHPVTRAKAHRKEPQKYSQDGPFSDIPAAAFELGPRKDLKRGDGGRALEKDPSHSREPADLVRTCLEHFRGGGRTQPGALELVLDICGELLDAGGVEEFAVDDGGRQHGGEHRPHRPRLEPDCACCPREPAARAQAGPESLAELLELFGPVGPRADWQVIDIESPDEHDHSQRWETA